MAILFTQIVRLSDRKVIVSAESPLSRGFERTHKRVLEDMDDIARSFGNETQFCSAKSSPEEVLVYFKKFGQILIMSAVEMGLSRTSVSLFFERLRDRFFEEYGDALAGDAAYIRFEDTIREESKRYSRDRRMEETAGILQEAKEVCIKNYTNVIQRGHKIDELELLGQKVQGVSEMFRKQTGKLRIEATAIHYLVYAGLVLILFVMIHLLLRK